MQNQDYQSNIIPTQKLKLENVPNQNGSWVQIGQFALTFNPHELEYNVFSNIPFLQILDENQNLTLAQLRSILYAEQRRWNHFNREPDRESMEGIKELIVRIREQL